MVYEARKQSMAWIETDYSKHTLFQWKIKWRLETLGALGMMGDTFAKSKAEKATKAAHLRLARSEWWRRRRLR